MSAYALALDMVRARACTVCLGNGVLAASSVFTTNGQHPYREQTITPCRHCDGTGFEPEEGDRA